MQKAKVEMKFALKIALALVAALLFIISQASCSIVPYQTSHTEFTSQSLEELKKGAVYINLGKTITAGSPDVVIDGSRIAIAAAGTYLISGTLDDGQLIIDTKDLEAVKLILNGVNITCADNAPIYVENAEEVEIYLAEGTENIITDGDSYILGDTTSDDPNAAIFSKDDLTITGSGSLTVNANYNNGIQSKDDLKITGGTITVNAANDGVKGRDSITIRDAAITINTGGDGMQSNNDEDAKKGTVLIESGTLTIIAAADGIQAQTGLDVSGGDITISTGGGSARAADHAESRQMPVNVRPNTGTVWSTDSITSTASAKGLKAGSSITITGGTLNIDSSDDSFNSNNSITISGGDITLSSGDDGIHADSALTVNAGSIEILKSYEGMESKVITINGGDIRLISSDDGINVSAGGGEQMPMGGRHGQNEFTASSDNYLTLNGGYLYIDAQGDGLDVNGPITMTGGTVIINGPTNDGNGALDYSGSFKITGGLLIAAGSSGMAMAPGQASTQYALMVNFEQAQSAGSIVHIENADGKNILTFAPAKNYQSVVLCSPQIQNGETCVVYTGGSSSGDVTDGLYSGGIYTGDTQIESFTISDMVTTVGSYSGGMGGFSGGPGGGGMMPGVPGGMAPDGTGSMPGGMPGVRPGR